jgi:hypothetical protein
MSNSGVWQTKRNGKAMAGLTQHSLYPKADDHLWTEKAPSARRARVQRQFLDVYFQINLAYAKLVALRAKWRSRPPKAAERALLRKIEESLVAREALEDRHACRGVIATPVYRDGFTVEVLFSDVHAGLKPGGALVGSSSSVCLNFRLPAALRAKLCKS